ncbi:hypothetical protein ATZ33_07745 [Enterococcus silesiacus]|uniref:Beta-lactamase-related domain-containing protein n=1 Tax=Enterococcus silesiacus TaxID=332949 RepID=A0A0S3KAC4_9ENTE|nr:serine hydrolase [Enterococcus silesiacus]ALS01264.1 hypothetical protein ATZ33_07745 [Enterococcus silesiacus]OJG92665.1 hypothetical protein RV15_GL003090 [Enterococcus silesiacus]
MDADIQDYLPEGTLNLTFNKKITILDLMHHTAGFEDRLEGLKLDNVEQIRPLKETITKEQPKQVYEPGTVTAYSNYSTALAGYIIERVTGQDFIPYMNQNILKPLQMNHSTFSMVYEDQPTIKDNVSLGYRSNESSFEVMDRFISNTFPAGSLLSSAADMNHFMIAQLNYEGTAPYKIFNQTETLKQMQTHSDGVMPEALGNAHGFWEKEVNNKRIIEHGGATLGFLSELSLVPEEGLGIVLLTNSLSGVTSTVQSEIETIFLGKPSDSADLSLKKSPTDKKVVGRYRSSRRVHSTMAKFAYIIMNDDLIITENKEGGINVKIPGEKEAIPLVELKSGIYQVAQKKKNIDGKKYMYFEFDEKGQVKRIVGDYLPVTSILDTQLFNLVAFAISILGFLGSLIYLVIKFIKQKRKKKADGWSKNYTVLTAFSVVGLLVLGVGIAMIMNFLSNSLMIISSMQPLFYINCLLPIFTVGMIVWLAATWRKNEAKWLTIFLIIIGLLTTVQFYNVHLFF